LLIAVGLLSSAVSQAVTEAYSPPIGGMSYTINAGTVSVPVTTSLTLPLLDFPAASGAAVGVISSFSSTTITVSGANWSAGALASVQYPYAVRITSGAAAGYTFSITANTADTLTISGGDPTLLGITAGVSGDTVRLIPVDTLNSLFGSTTFLGGTSPAVADIVTLSNTAQLAYYYNTSLARWVRTTGPTTDRGNTPIPLDSVISVTRKTDAMVLRFIGAVPLDRFNFVVPNSGAKYTHTGFPTDVAIGVFSLQTALSGWVSSPTAANADTLSVISGAGYLSYFHNGTYWQRTTGPSTNRDSVVINAGTPILIFKRGSNAGSSLLLRNRPYNF
jgi:uncharacterized protein (TIGR02597 family)